MLFKHVIKYLVLFLLFIGQSSFGQNGGFTFNFTETKVVTDNTGIIDAYVKIKNTSGQSLTGSFDVQSNTEDLYLVQRKPREVVLAANDSIFIPIKAIVSNTAAAGTKSAIEAAFTVSNTQETKTVKLPVTISERKQVKMFLMDSHLIYERVGDSLSIPVRISNEGNKRQRINVVARYANSLGTNSLDSRTITIEPFKDTTFVLRKAVTRAILSEDEFTINITALYLNGDIVGTGSIRASSLKQDRRYTTPYANDYAAAYQQANQVTASYQLNNNDIASYFLYANAQAEINKGTLAANLDMNWWESSEQMFIRNTWLSYKQKTFGATVGSITKFLDINLIGRGAEAYYSPNEKNTITAGAIDKTFNLFDNHNISLGQSAWSTFTHNGGSMAKGYDLSLIYDQDDYYGTENYLAASRFSIFDKEFLTLKVGGSVSNASTPTENKIGGAGEVLFGGKLKNFFYNSSNYVSSGYFSGLRKGVVNLNERISLTLEDYSFWAVYNYLSVDPEILGSQFSSAKFLTERYDLGISRRFKSLTLSLSPYYYKEKRNERLIADAPRDYSLEAARANLGISYFNSPSGQNLSLSFEGGTYTSDTDGEKLHYKANLNYSWRMLNLLAFYQYNNFYLGEVISSQQLGTTETYYNLTISPTVELKFFNSNLIARAGFLYSQNSLFDNMVQLNGRFDINITRSFSAFVTGFYSRMEDNASQTNTIQFGLTKKFNPIKIDRTKSNLEIYVYYDTNGKGPFDKQNAPAANQLVIIDGKAFRTNSNGMIRYRALPAGNYEVRPVNSNEWHAQSRSITLAEDTRVDIGLNKTATIKGSIAYFATDKSYNITQKLAGVSIIAVDDAGNVFNTKTDDTGNYIMYIPKGHYTLTVEKASVSEFVDVENNNITVEAVPDQVKDFKFRLNIKEKRVETRKFGSQGPARGN